MPLPPDEYSLVTDDIPGATIYYNNRRGCHVVTYEKPVGGRPSLAEILNAHFKPLGFSASAYDNLDSYEHMTLPFAEALKDLSESLRPAREFMQYMVDFNRARMAAAQRLYAEGLLDIRNAFYVFQPNRPYLFYAEPTKSWQIGVLRSIQWKVPYMGPPYLSSIFDVCTYGQVPSGNVASRGLSDACDIGTVTCEIKYSEEMKDASQSPVKNLDEKDLRMMAERGRAYLERARRRAICDYDGPFFFKVGPVTQVVAHSGRVVADVGALMSLQPQVASGMAADLSGPLEITTGWRHADKVSAEAAFMGAHPAFSLSLRRWGVVQVERLTDTVFRTGAVDSLVLPQRRKSLLRALVSHDQDGKLRDIVDQKASATLVLLEGAPGCGKTISAQAVAESLKRPLYCVDLNTLNLERIEDSLRALLKLAQRWRGVVLIDEADSLLRHRQDCTPEEARRVSTFLRVLEEHEGIIFLTSNHLRDIDKALLSRVSLVMRYGEPDRGLRTSIWTNLLKSVPGREALSIDVGALSKWPINGREIKHAIKMGLVLAQDRQVPLSTGLLQSVLAEAHGSRMLKTMKAAMVRLHR